LNNSRNSKRSKNRSRNGSRNKSRNSSYGSSGRKRRYYHIETEKHFVHKSSADADNYDFHQRKSKEIRRLQYMADLENRRGRKRSKPKVKPVKREKVQEPKRILEEYPVWVLDSETLIPYAAILTNEYSFKPFDGDSNAEEKVLEIKEGDKVNIKLRGIQNQNPPPEFQP
jgi:putative lipase involved disintegration of autophagic bodies